MAPYNDASDPRDDLVHELFARLCRAVLDDGRESAITERRLWHLPEVVAEFVFPDAPAEQRQHVDRLVHSLRLEAGALINQRLDRSGVIRALAMRVALAKRQFALRPWRHDDLPHFITLLGNAELWEKLPENYPGPIPLDVAEHLIELANGFPERHIVSAVEYQDEPIGQVRLQFDSSPYSDSAEISYWIGKPYWGKGLATGLVTLFTSESFTARPGLLRVFARVQEDHTASIRVLEKAGYRREPSLFSRQRQGPIPTLTFGVCRGDYANVGAEPRAAMARAVDPPARGPARKRRTSSLGQAGWLVLSGELAHVLETCAAV